MKFYLRIVSFVGFVTSAVFTYLAYVNANATKTEVSLGIAMTIVCQLGSFLFLQLSLQMKKGKLAFTILAILLFTLSIVATISYQSKRQSTIENENIVKSEKYKEAKKINETEQKKFDNLANDIETEKQAIAKLTQDNDNVIESILKDMNDSKTPQWRKEQIGLTLKKTQESQTELLKQKNDNLKNLQEKYQSFSFTKIDDVQVEEVLSKTFEQNLASISGFSETKVKTLMQIFFAIVFELTAIGAHGALSYYKDKTDIFDKFKDGTKQAIAKLPKVSIPVPEMVPKKPKTVLAKTEPKKLKLKTYVYKKEKEKSVDHVLIEKNKNKFNREDLKKYIQTMYEHSKNNISIGYKKLARLSNLSEGIAKDIHRYLQEKKVVQVDNGKTRILINQ